MDLNSISGVTGATNAGAVTQSSSQSSPSITSDFQTFLKMLTVQLQNQDPLEPMAATDFSVQLATFSSVEQQTQTNNLLSNLGSQFSVMNMSQLAGWVGHEARSSADLWYDGRAASLSMKAEPAADQSILVVRNQAGDLVARETLPRGTTSYEWYGADAKGDALPDGRYRLTVEHSRGGQFISSQPVEHYGRIVEARGSASGATLLLQGGIEISAADITALRNTASH